MSDQITLTARTEEQADAMLYQMLADHGQPFAAAEIKHYAQMVADRLGISFCVDHEGNVRMDSGFVRWSGRP